jgi:hypothetical protein
MTLASVNESDAFALAMITVMVCGLLVIGSILFTILRSGARRNHDVEELMDDFEREQRKAKAPAKKAPAGKTGEPWEKDADWWKKD